MHRFCALNPILTLPGLGLHRGFLRITGRPIFEAPLSTEFVSLHARSRRHGHLPCTPARKSRAIGDKSCHVGRSTAFRWCETESRATGHLSCHASAALPRRSCFATFRPFRPHAMRVGGTGGMRQNASGVARRSRRGTTSVPWHDFPLRTSGTRSNGPHGATYPRLLRAGVIPKRGLRSETLWGEGICEAGTS